MRPSRSTVSVPSLPSRSASARSLVAVIAGFLAFPGARALAETDRGSPANGPRARSEASTGAKAVSRPNIVFILADDLGWSDLGPYGSEVETPHLDRLAAEGIRFTRMHNTSKCFPSRACLLTGVYAQRTGMSRRPGAIENALTIGEALRSAGYHTLAVGKHHGTENLFDRGFDHYRGLRDGACNYFNPGEERPSDPGPPAQKRRNGRVWCFDEGTVKPYTPEDPDFYTTDAFTDWALELLREHHEGRKNTEGEDGKNERRPFFLYLAYNAPHDPLQAWPEDIAEYDGRYDRGYAAIRKARYERQLAMRLIDRKRFPLSEPTHRDWEALSDEEREDQARRMEVYAAMIDRMDRNIGRLLAYLEERGVLDDTVVFFASDNGASAEIVRKGSGPIGSMTRWASLGGDWANVGNTPMRYYKNFSYEGGIATPLIVRWPRVIQGGRITHEVGHFVDVLPTLLEIAGAEYPTERDGKTVLPPDGRSFLPILAGEEAPPRAAPLFWKWQKGKAIYRDGWKLVTRGGEVWQLFHLDRDATETRDLIGERPELARELESLWTRWWESTAARGAEEAASRSEPVFYDPVEKEVDGWTVRVDPSLLEDEHREVRDRAFAALANHLERVTFIALPDRLARLRELPIWLELENPKLGNMQYHPNRGWLVEHGHDPRLVKHVHIPRARKLYDPKMWAKHPYVVLHELAHSYHDQVLGFDHAGIIAAYEEAKERGIYESVLLYTGKKVKHYGLNNPKEYFAEATEAYFGVNDFYPFVRAELEEHDPRAYKLLVRIWGEIR